MEFNRRQLFIRSFVSMAGGASADFAGTARASTAAPRTSGETAGAYPQDDLYLSTRLNADTKFTAASHRSDGNGTSYELSAEIQNLLGTSHRAPRSEFHNLDSNQRVGTGSSVRAASRLGVPAGNFFSQHENRRMLSEAESPLEQFIANFKEGTISIGRERPGEGGDLKVGKLHAFSLGMTDFRRDGLGASVTIGAGMGPGGAFYSASIKGNETYHSFGVFAELNSGSPSIVYFAAINVTAAIGGSFEIDHGVLITKGPIAVEISFETHPMQTIHNFIQEGRTTIEEVLGPAADYRTFLGPYHPLRGL